MTYFDIAVFYFIFGFGQVHSMRPAAASLFEFFLNAEHTSLNSIEVQISAANLSYKEDTSGHITTFPYGSYHVKLTQDHCQSNKVEGEAFIAGNLPMTQHFWDVAAYTDYTVCVRDGMETGTHTNWTWIVVSCHISEPPSLAEFGIARHHDMPGDQSRDTYYYLPFEDVTIHCSANGEPQPNITWLRYGAPLIFGNVRVHAVGVAASTSQRAMRSSLTVGGADGPQIEGRYTCRATNEYGQVTSRSAVLYRAVLEPFPVDEQNREYTVASGDSVHLSCRAPFSQPLASFSWRKIRTRTDREPQHVAEDHRRMVMQSDGRLLFLSTTDQDEGLYRCDVYNAELDRLESGGYSRIKLVKGVASKLMYPPRLLHHSPLYIPAKLRSDVTITCIFGGKPTPHVFWYRTGVFPSSRHIFGANNTTMTVKNLTVADEGTYQCNGFSQGKSTPKLDFTFAVYAPPTWVKRPVSQTVTVGDKVVFECVAFGLQTPSIAWFINGNVLQDYAGTTSYNLNADGSALIFYNVTKSDLVSLQCNATNAHGSIQAQAILNVMLVTVITRAPEDSTLPHNGVVFFDCEVQADPGALVKITWMRGSKPIQAFDTSRLYVQPDKSLVVNATNEVDGGNSLLGLYTCVAQTGRGHVKASARLDPPPLSTAVLASSTSYTNLLWIGLVSGLVSLLILSLLMLVLARRKQALGTRVSVDAASMVVYMANNTREGGEAPLVCSDDHFAGLTLFEDDSLHNALQEVFIPRCKVELGSLVGKGQFGRVYAGKLQEGVGKTTSRVAIKTLKYKSTERDIVDLFLREALMMKDFCHAHVLSLIGISVEQDGSPLVLLPFMENGDLRTYIQEPSKEITVLELLRYGLQVARGMVYLGDMRFVHRDLAARNCMVDVHRVVKVADFGLSRDLYCRDYYRVGECKMPLPVRWMAPESLDGSVFTTQSDVWSLGVLLWELMTRGAVPYPDIDNWDIGAYIRSNKRLAQPLYCPDAVYAIMTSCWADQPDDRPSFAVVVKGVERIVRSAKSAGVSSAAGSHFYLNITPGLEPHDYRHCSA